MSKGKDVSKILEGVDLLGFGNSVTYGDDMTSRAGANPPRRTATAKSDKDKAALSMQTRSPK